MDDDVKVLERIYDRFNARDIDGVLTVLSQSMLDRLHVCSQTLQLLADRRVRAHLLPNQEAVTLYNRLRDRERVAGLIHTTC